MQMSKDWAATLAAAEDSGALLGPATQYERTVRAVA
jgi:hypothetical protein